MGCTWSLHTLLFVCICIYIPIHIHWIQSYRLKLQNIQNAIGTYKKTFVYFSINAEWTRFAIFCCALFHHTDWLVQERRKSIADALGLNFSGTNPSK